MTAYPAAELSSADLAEIFDYLDSPPKPTTGQGLYKDYCQNCHGANARGGITGRSIISQSASSAISDVRKGHHAGEFGTRRNYMPRWSSAQLSDAEIRLIQTYYSEL